MLLLPVSIIAGRRVGTIDTASFNILIMTLIDLRGLEGVLLVGLITSELVAYLLLALVAVALGGRVSATAVDVLVNSLVIDIVGLTTLVVATHMLPPSVSIAVVGRVRAIGTEFFCLTNSFA